MFTVGSRGVISLTLTGGIIVIIFYYLFIGNCNETNATDFKTKGLWKSFDTVLQVENRLNLKGNLRFTLVQFFAHNVTKSYEGYYDDGWRIAIRGYDGRIDTLRAVSDLGDTVICGKILELTPKAMLIHEVATGKIISWQAERN
jgi:hypothetical protein